LKFLGKVVFRRAKVGKVQDYSKTGKKDQQTDKYFEVKGDKLEYKHHDKVLKEYTQQGGM
jgi:hypothetical protein